MEEANCSLVGGHSIADEEMKFGYAVTGPRMCAPTSRSPGSIRRFIRCGVRRTAMPAWGKIMAGSEIWQVVALLDHLDNLPPAVGQELHRPALSNS
jgi:hypothetical protein